MKLSIITINYNNAEGLRRTLASVATQTYHNIEHIIIDGGSNDGSVDIIRDYESTNLLNSGSIDIKWVSEPDKGIYNSMNKGIEIALGRRIVNSFNRSEQREDKHCKADQSEGIGDKNKELSDYIQILNSADTLISDTIIECMMAQLKENDFPDLLYGNSVNDRVSRHKSSHGPNLDYSLRLFYNNTYPHESTFFKKELFSEDGYGLYDESLKIVSDWKWYLQAIGLGNVKPVYVDIDVILFDMNGISSTNKQLDTQERRRVLKEVLPPAIYADYVKYAFPMSQYDRLKKYHVWGFVSFVERVLFKLEKWHIIR